MALTNDKQSSLELEAFDYRENIVGKLDKYIRELNEYSENNVSAKMNETPWGKGTGVSMGYTTVDEARKEQSKTRMNYGNMVTTNAGGLYDRKGNPQLFGEGGRDWLKHLNYYGPEKPYGVNSVDTSVNVKEAGQYVVK